MATGYHNHQPEWQAIDGKRPMDVLAANTPKDVVLQLDVGTCVESGADPVAWINANPGRIRSVHCKDWAAGANRGYAVAFGEGDAPWKKIFDAAEATGGVEYYLIEQEESSRPDPDGAALHGELEEAAVVAPRRSSRRSRLHHADARVVAFDTLADDGQRAGGTAAPGTVKVRLTTSPVRPSSP